jgi:hypothetical protein
MKKLKTLDEKFFGTEINKLIFTECKKFIGEINVTAVIIDEELDPIECSFHYDGCVNINTEGLTYAILSIENLRTLIRLTNKAEAYFEGVHSERIEK